MQNIDVFNKHLKSSFMINKYESITYKGSYELDFLKKYKQNLIAEVVTGKIKI